LTVAVAAFAIPLLTTPQGIGPEPAAVEVVAGLKKTATEAMFNKDAMGFVSYEDE
jgi:hypothetical protein